MKEKLKELMSWLKKHSLLLRLIFFGSILIFVANQVANIAHGMSWAEVGQTMGKQANSTLILMALLGFVGVLPMLGYDWVTISILEAAGRQKMPRGSWFIAAWTTNTINNLAGFGGIVGASLRSNFYGKNFDRKKVLATVSKVAFFMFSGLSLWALWLLVDLFLLHHTSHFRNYWIWLVGGSLYAPALFTLTYLRRKKLFRDLFPKRVIQLAFTSFCQWAGALAVFLGIGYLMQLDVALAQVYPMFLIATLIGMLTMVPGGMGTFDVLMILGLGQLGSSQNQTVVWLLYYRLFYYLIPFLSGLILFVSQTGVKFNRFFDNLPRLVLQRVAHIIVVIAVYFAGIMMVLLSTVTNLSNLSQIFEFLLPFSFNFLDQTLNLLIGFVLLGLARGLYSKVKRAYVPTLFVLVFGIVNTISRTRSLRLMVVYCLILLAVLFARKEFYREKFVYSWGAIIFDVALFGTLLVAYAVAGFHSGQWWNANLMGGQFVLFPSDDVWISGMIGLGVGALTLLSLQQYLTRSSETLGDSFDQMRFEKLLTRYGGTKSSQRLELSGYHYYYYQVNGQDRVVFGYQIKSNRCFILGEPIGDKTLWQQATQAFMVAADNLGYQLAFYKISEKFVVQLHDLGFQFAKIGETGTANLGTADYLQQEVYRKLSVQGYTFKKYETLPAELLPQLAAVSNAWLNGKGEKYFGNGRFETDYILKSPVAVARNNENQIVGFITQQAISPNWVSYDLLRILPEAPKELANFLVLGMLASWEQAGFKKVDLGMVPLAQVGAGPFAFFEERIMNIIYRYGNAIYNFQDNFSGKQKYVTHWEGCYFAYLKGSNFYLAAAQLLRLIGRGKNKGPTLVEEVILEE